MTAIADPPPVTVEPSPPAGFTLPAPVATIAADLLPDEIRVKRRLGYLKRRLAFVIAALVALVVLGDLLVRQQTTSAQGELSGANDHISTLNSQLDHFNGVLTIQSETQAIWGQLGTVLGDDVSWPALLNRLALPVPSGLRLTSIDAQVSDPSSTTAAGATVTSPITAATVGTITLSGSAPNWQAVATYVHGLSAEKDFVAVNPSTVSHGSGSAGANGSGLTFTLTLDLTDRVLSNRYTASASQGVTASSGSSAAGAFDKAAGSSSNSSGSTKHGTSDRTAGKGHNSATRSATTGSPQEAN